jgi:hypothetical protein
MQFVPVGSAAAAVVGSMPVSRAVCPEKSRYVQERDGHISLLEIANGDFEIIGETTTHQEAEQIARLLAQVTGRCIPVTLHKLALAYLALAAREAAR